MEVEEWRPVPGYEGVYEVSDLGNVRGLDREITYRNGRRQHYPGRLLSVHLNKRRRRTVVLWSASSKRTQTVYTLVLNAFVGPRPPGMEACHGDGNSANDQLTNLRWDTRAANMADQIRHGTHGQASKVRCSRGHRLVEPNLVSFRLARGERDCLACDRAKQNGKYARQHGRVLDVDVRADEHYRKIMSTSC